MCVCIYICDKNCTKWQRIGTFSQPQPSVLEEEIEKTRWWRLIISQQAVLHSGCAWHTWSRKGVEAAVVIFSVSFRPSLCTEAQQVQWLTDLCHHCEGISGYWQEKNIVLRPVSWEAFQVTVDKQKNTFATENSHKKSYRNTLCKMQSERVELKECTTMASRSILSSLRRCLRPRSSQCIINMWAVTGRQ